ncbi:hypothetical protein GMA12_02360 [Kocuria sediminis]|uniref:Uncharacterized protein n=1 Tax=Kocuria sediminis TaxID=1038857 RepID=A0A6N8GIB8_9MICC|nr:hypothetical protein [Kocuria sediminis]MUN61997.1 hypothetical protein [Kocuria sediminis]
MDEEIRLSGADHPHVQIPRLGELDAIWVRRIVLAALFSLVVGLLAGIAAALLLGADGTLGPAQWGLMAGGAALLLSGIVLSLTRADDAPRNDLMDARARASRGLRMSVRREAIPQDPVLREMQDYMAVEMVQYAWPIALAVPGMALVVWAIFVPAPVVVVALLLVLVWAVIRVNGTVVGRRYYGLRGLL